MGCMTPACFPGWRWGQNGRLQGTGGLAEHSLAWRGLALGQNQDCGARKREADLGQEAKGGARKDSMACLKDPSNSGGVPRTRSPKQRKGEGTRKAWFLQERREVPAFSILSPALSTSSPLCLWGQLEGASHLLPCLRLSGSLVLS